MKKIGDIVVALGIVVYVSGMLPRLLDRALSLQSYSSVRYIGGLIAIAGLSIGMPARFAKLGTKHAKIVLAVFCAGIFLQSIWILLQLFSIHALSLMWISLGVLFSALVLRFLFFISSKLNTHFSEETD